MSAICIHPSKQLPVSLAMAKANMRIDGDDMDDLVSLWIEGIVAALEHEIGQHLMEQTWRVTFDRFGGEDGASRPVDQMRLPHPAIGIAAVKYFDADGNEQTLAPADYQLNVTRYASNLVLARGARWPITDTAAEAVTIDVVCGYGSTPDATPHNIRLYILAKLVEQFDPATRAERETVQSMFLDRLLDACRTYA